MPSGVIRHAFVGGLPELKRVLWAGKGVPREAVAQPSHCKRGHKLSGDNVSIQRGGRGNYYRSCKACQRERGRAYRARLRRG